jgi:hypothetical protein
MLMTRPSSLSLVKPWRTTKNGAFTLTANSRSNSSAVTPS